MITTIATLCSGNLVGTAAWGMTPAATIAIAPRRTILINNVTARRAGVPTNDETLAFQRGVRAVTTTLVTGVITPAATTGIMMDLTPATARDGASVFRWAILVFIGIATAATQA